MVEVTTNVCVVKRNSINSHKILKGGRKWWKQLQNAVKWEQNAVKQEKNVSKCNKAGMNHHKWEQNIANAKKEGKNMTKQEPGYWDWNKHVMSFFLGYEAGSLIYRLVVCRCSKLFKKGKNKYGVYDILVWILIRKLCS